MTQGHHARRRPRPSLALVSGPLFLVANVAVLGYVTSLVARHTIAVVESRHLLPRWDLATHLGSGWLDYRLLTTGRIPQLLWDLWLQGYWPPVHSIFQVPFFVVLGGGMASGLWSSLAAFLRTCAIGCVLLLRQWKDGGALPTSVFTALLVTSPFLLAYASVPMTEMLGALVQMLVLLAYQHYRDARSARAARFFAISLTVLFFTKYNYFFLLIVPLLLVEWLERTAGWGITQRIGTAWRSTWRIVSTPIGAILALYAIGLAIVVATGGFEFRAFGQRVSVRTIGNTGHVVLYLLIGRVWYLHRRRRIDWARAMSRDPLIRPVLLWFVLPVLVWMAAPYPNHIRDFANLVFNRPLGAPTVEAGVATYLDALHSSYFFSPWVLAGVSVIFVVAAAAYTRQPPVMQCLILAVPIQFAVIALHQTRFPRFLLLTVVLLCLAASSELGRWFTRSSRSRLAGTLVAPLVLGIAVAGAHFVVAEDRFRAVAFENYSDSQTLRAALESIRAELTDSDRLAIVGQGNELSPGLFRWELGPPSGAPCFPYELGGARGIDLALATRVLVIDPLGGDSAALDATSYYSAQRASVMERVGRGEFVARREIPLPDMGAIFRLYDRTSTAAATVPCQ